MDLVYLAIVAALFALTYQCIRAAGRPS